MSTSGGLVTPNSAVAGLTTDIKASSGVVANAVATATLPAALGKTTFLIGFDLTVTGATAGLEIVAVINFGGATWSYPIIVPAGATSNAVFIQRSLHRPAPADAPNTAIVGTVPAAGAGDVAVCMNIHGYQQ